MTVSKEKVISVRVNGQFVDCTITRWDEDFIQISGLDRYGWIYSGSPRIQQIYRAIEKMANESELVYPVNKDSEFEDSDVSDDDDEFCPESENESGNESESYDEDDYDEDKDESIYNYL